MRKEDNTNIQKNKNTIKQEKIKEENIRKFTEKIEENKKISSKFSKKIKTLVFINIIIAFVLAVYFFLMNSSLIQNDAQLNLKIFKVISLLISVLSVVLLEIGYNKESGYIFLHGIEAFIISVVTLYIINLYMVNINLYKNIILGIPLIIGVYYIVKALVIYIRLKKEDLKQKSDISEIVKKKK